MNTIAKYIGTRIAVITTRINIKIMNNVTHIAPVKEVIPVNKPPIADVASVRTISIHLL
jgi:hypothetical protein